MSFETLSLLSGTFVILGFVVYIRATVWGPNKPSKASWIIWLVMDTITFFGMYLRHSLNGQIIAAMGGWAVVGVILKYGKPGWSVSDKIYLAAAGVLLPLTFVNATAGIVASCIVLLVGAWDTFVHAFRHPEEENRLAWIFYWIACIPVLVGIPVWDFDHAAQPITFAIIETVVLGLICLPRPTHDASSVNLEA